MLCRGIDYVKTLTNVLQIYTIRFQLNIDIHVNKITNLASL